MNFSITFSISAKKGSQDFGSNFIDSVDKSEDYCLLKTEKAMATHSSTSAWKIPWTGSLVGCGPWGHEELDMTERLHFHFSLSCIGEGNGSPL